MIAIVNEGYLTMGPSIGAYSGLLAITFPYLLLKISNEAIERS